MQSITVAAMRDEEAMAAIGKSLVVVHKHTISVVAQGKAIAQVIMELVATKGHTTSLGNVGAIIVVMKLAIEHRTRDARAQDIWRRCIIEIPPGNALAISIS